MQKLHGMAPTSKQNPTPCGNIISIAFGASAIAPHGNPCLLISGHVSSCHDPFTSKHFFCRPFMSCPIPFLRLVVISRCSILSKTTPYHVMSSYMYKQISLRNLMSCFPVCHGIGHFALCHVGDGLPSPIMPFPVMSWLSF